MLEMLLPWSRKLPRPRKSLLAGPVWSWGVALAFRRVYPVLTTFPYQIPAQIQPTCCSWCWTLESWQLTCNATAIQSRSLVAARLDATVYALDTEQLTLDRALDCSVVLWKKWDPGMLNAKRPPKHAPKHIKDLSHMWIYLVFLYLPTSCTVVLLEDRGKRGKILRVFSFSKHNCSMSMYVTVDMTVSELHRFCFDELIHQRKSCSSCDSGVRHCIKVFRCNTCRTCCKQPLTNKASIDDMNVEKHDPLAVITIFASIGGRDWVVQSCCTLL